MSVQTRAEFSRLEEQAEHLIREMLRYAEAGEWETARSYLPSISLRYELLSRSASCK